MANIYVRGRGLCVWTRLTLGSGLSSHCPHVFFDINEIIRPYLASLLHILYSARSRTDVHAARWTAPDSEPERRYVRGVR